MAGQDAGVRRLGRQVQRRLAAQAGQQAVGVLAGQDAVDRLDGQGLQVDDVGHAGVGHDRGRVRVEQDRAHALLAQGAAGLRAGVVELRRLADDDRPGADEQDAGRRWTAAAAGISARPGRRP